MPRHTSLPFHLYVHVDNAFLGPAMPEGTTQGIWHGVYGREGQVLACHVLLQSGAHWSGLPVHALAWREGAASGDAAELMPWGCMGAHVEVWHAEYLEGLPGSVRQRRRLDDGSGEGTVAVPLRHTGIGVDWSDGFSRYPQEHKPLSLVALDSGRFALLPNNYFMLSDKHFTANDIRVKHYRRGERVYWEA